MGGEAPPDKDGKNESLVEAMSATGNDYQAAIAFHPTRPVLAVASHDGHVRIYGVAGDQFAKPPLLLDKEVGGDIRGIAFSADGAGLWVAAGPPTGKVFRFTVAATP